MPPQARTGSRSLRAPTPGSVGPVAQWSEPAAHNGLVAGSSPARPTNVRRRRRRGERKQQLTIIHRCLPRPAPHNMDDELPFAAHIVRRGPVYQYVRRIPDDVRDASPLSRIQRSLRTREKAHAFSAAASVHAEVERQFAAARRAKGVTLHVIPLDGWEGPDWQKLADWFEASLSEQDWQARLRTLPSSAYGDGFDRRRL